MKANLKKVTKTVKGGARRAYWVRAAEISQKAGRQSVRAEAKAQKISTLGHIKLRLFGTPKPTGLMAMNPGPHGGSSASWLALAVGALKGVHPSRAMDARGHAEERVNSVLVSASRRSKEHWMDEPRGYVARELQARYMPEHAGYSPSQQSHAADRWRGSMAQTHSTPMRNIEHVPQDPNRWVR